MSPAEMYSLQRFHAAQKLRARGSGMDLEFLRRSLAGFAPHRRAQSRRQLSFEHGNIAHCAVVSAARALPRNVCRSHDMNLVAQVIKSQQPVEEHQFAIWQRKIVLRVLAYLFKLPHHIVGKIADGAGGERRQTQAPQPADARSAKALRTQRRCLRVARACGRVQFR